MRPNLSWLKTMRCVIAAALGTCAFTAGATPAANEPQHVIQAPHYGDGLFHFYQERYFSALTGLMVSQHFVRVGSHADEAEILRGGLLLSYGLHREAGEVFAQLIDKGAAPAVRDRAWFFLAKIRYQRGLHREALDALGRIGKQLPSELEEERVLLQAQVLMATADFAGAASVLQTLPEKSAAAPYARYNLGVAWVKAGDAARGTALLDELGRAPAASDELRGLRDKANVALGFAALQDNRADSARNVLQRVRLTGPQSNKALLGFGWAAAVQKAPRDALVPWTELAQRDASDAAVLEARLALPYALAEIGAYGQSLERYNDAIAAYEREHKGLNESIAAIRAGKLVEGLLERNPGDQMGWFQTLNTLPAMPHAGHLAPLLAQHEFQEAFKNFRDLRFLTRNLEDWQNNLGVYGDMLTQRRAAYAERLPPVQAKARETGLAAMQQHRETLNKELTRVQTEADAPAFADAKQRELIERLERVQATLRRDSIEGADVTEIAKARERARLVAGALTWQLAENYPARLWTAQKELKATDAELARAQRGVAAVAQAQRDEPARHDAFAKRIAALAPRINVLLPRLAALSREQQGVVQELAVAELTQQQERLAAYSTQARFAVAQLYDRAQFAKKDDAHAPK